MTATSNREFLIKEKPAFAHGFFNENGIKTIVRTIFLINPILTNHFITHNKNLKLGIEKTSQYNTKKNTTRYTYKKNPAISGVN